MTSFDGWDTRIHGSGPAGGHSGMAMVLRDAPGWSMSYRGTAVHGTGFGRGHYRGDRAPVQLYGTRGSLGNRASIVAYGTNRRQNEPAMPTQGIVGGFEWGNVHRAAHSDIRSYENGFEWRNDTLMHFRTKGSKNGVRRYQTEDGTWTPLGLKERRIREGFGERRAARKEARAQRREERATRKAAERSRRAEEMAKYKEQQRKKNPKNWTDEELRRGIERKRMEQEYRELAKSPLLKVGEKLVGKYMDYRVKKMEKEMREDEQRFEYIKMKLNSRNQLARARADIATAKANVKRAEADELEVRRGGKKAENQAKLVGAKLAYRNTTVRGGIGNLINKSLTGLGERGRETSKARAQTTADVRNAAKVRRYNERHPSAGMQYYDTDTRRKNSWAHDETMEKYRTRQAYYNSRGGKKKP